MSASDSVSDEPRPPERAAGVGIWIAPLYDDDAPDKRGGIVILEVLAGSAAERAGVRAGDRITHVGEQSLAGLSLEQIVTEHLRGAPASEARLRILRGQKTPGIEIRVARESSSISD
jgi:carboxyl-terminal processing protease